MADNLAGKSGVGDGGDARSRPPPLNVNPQIGIAKIVGQIKGYTAHALREEFPWLKKRLPSVWTRLKFIKGRRFPRLRRRRGTSLTTPFPVSKVAVRPPRWLRPPEERIPQA
jgi:hypothetical protein